MEQKELNKIYQQLKHLQSQIPQVKDYPSIEPSIVNNYHLIIDELIKIKGNDCSRFKISRDAWNEGFSNYRALPLRTQLGSVIGFLAGELEIEEPKKTNNSNNVVTVINQNTLAVNIQQTLNQLIERTENKEEKEKLTELNKELEKEEKNWDKIKSILIWILNFSKDLFMQILPELLKRM